MKTIFLGVATTATIAYPYIMDAANRLAMIADKLEKIAVIN